MAGRIPEHILEDILNRTDIAQLISGYIPLKRAGRNFKALCPFHHEKTPSFMVSADRQIYHCFGCGAGGNAFNFLMKYERLDFIEAVETLAAKAGIALPKEQRQDEKAGLSTQLYKINELAAEFYANILKSPAAGLPKNYLLKRGIRQETLGLFQVGYAPDRWDGLINYLRAKGISLGLLEKAGLALSREGGGYYDRFRNRIIFPIFDIKSRPLGFGARVLDNTLPKYINSPETPIYIKGRNLYGLNFAKEAIRENDSVIIVEGYLDLVIPYQEGLKNIVASQGTALTLEQIRLLKRYTSDVVMVYDADMAGELATLRSLDIFIEEGLNPKVVSLPQGFDPDSFVRQRGIADFRERVNQAKNLFDYKLGVLKLRHNPTQIEGKSAISADMLATINKFKNAVLKSEYLKKLSEDLSIKEDALLEELKKLKSDTRPADSLSVDYRKPANINPTEKLLIKLMLEETELIHRIKETLEPADFQDSRTSRVVAIMFDLIDQGKDIEPKRLLAHLEDEGISQIVCESIFLPEQLLEDREKVVQDCVHRLKKEKIKLKRQHLHDEIKAAQHLGDEERLQKLVEEFHQLIKTG